ncbi:MAG: glycosyltransferase [Candidatus Accumulibacter sp.]|uniref:Glycosyltransferase n=1 Tax=Candidatus Accumulibacter proximus TaxID=2954385 RepID=A0A935PYV7_9PROT|nr:glycosyltransferase [Candidatus Accumulibacter proximus]
MKIIFIHQNFPGQFKHLAPALAAGGDEVIALGINRPAYATAGVRVILHRPQAANAEAFKEAPIDVQETLAKTTRGHSVARCLSRLKEQGFVPDVIVAHSGWGEAYFIKDVFPGVPLIVYAEYFYGTEGGDAYFDPEFTRSSLEGLERLRLKNTHLLHALVAADQGLSPTRFQRDRHPQLLRQKISVIHDGIDSERLKPNPGARVHLKRAGLDLGSTDEVVTFVARELEPYRGYHIFMRALPELLVLRPRLQVVVVGGHGVSYGAAPPAGTTWKDVFFNEVADRIDRRRVHFVGRLPHEVLTQLMQVAAVHLYLTYPFVLSWSLMEAMSIGCLIVASRTAPVEELIEHGRTGLLVDFFDAHQIALTVADALQRRAELIPLRRAARQHIVQGYDLKTRCLPAQVELLRRVGQAASS